MDQGKEKVGLLFVIKGSPFKLFEENGDIHPSFRVQNRHLGEKGRDREGERGRERERERERERVKIKREIHLQYTGTGTPLTHPHKFHTVLPPLWALCRRCVLAPPYSGWSPVLTGSPSDQTAHGWC